MGVAKLTEADGAGNLSRLAKQPRSGTAWPLGLEATTLCGKGAGGFPCTPATWRTRVWAAPTVLARPLGSRSRGGKCAVGTHLRVLGLQGTEPALCSLAWLSGDRWAHVGSVAKAAPCALRLILITFKCSCRASLWPLAEPFHEVRVKPVRAANADFDAL